MSPAAVLAELDAQGVSLSRRGQSIVITPTAKATAEVVALVKSHKPALLAMLPDVAGSAISTPAPSGKAHTPTAAPERHSAPPARPQTQSGGLTDAERAELAELMDRYAKANGFSDEDRDEALQTAIRFNWLDYMRQEVAKLSPPFVITPGYKYLVGTGADTDSGSFQFVVEVPEQVDANSHFVDIWLKHHRAGKP